MLCSEPTVKVATKESRKEVAKKLAITGAKTQSPKKGTVKKVAKKRHCKKSHEKKGTVKKDAKKEELV